MNNSSNVVASKSLAASITSSATTTGTVIDLANFTNVGKRAIKLTIGVVDCKLTSTTDQTISVGWYQGDTTATSLGSAITSAAITSGTTVSGYQEFNVLPTSRYIWAQAYATGTVPAWGVVAAAFPLRRDF
jgi:hypothetical protein